MSADKQSTSVSITAGGSPQPHIHAREMLNA